MFDVFTLVYVDFNNRRTSNLALKSFDLERFKHLN
jgi:hypothetical protein